MAYVQKYDEKIFKKIELNQRGDYLVLKTLSNNNGNVESYDIRKYYTPEGSKDIAPTKQGIRLKYEDMVEMLDALIKNVDENVFSNLVISVREREESDESSIDEPKDYDKSKPNPHEELYNGEDDLMEIDLDEIDWSEIDI